MSVPHSPCQSEHSGESTPGSITSVKTFDYDIECTNSKFPDAPHNASDKIIQISITYRQKDGTTKTWDGCTDEANKHSLSPSDVILNPCKSENELLSKFIQEIELLTNLEKRLVRASH